MFRFTFRSFSHSHILVVLLSMLVAPIAAQANSYTYTAGSFDQGFAFNDPRRNYNWQNEFNWQPQGIPGAGDDATVSNGLIVFLTQSVTINNLTVGGNGDTNVRGASHAEDLTITGTCNWSAGIIGFGDLGNFNIVSGATLNLLGTADKQFGGVQLNNAGTINWSGTGRLNTNSIVNNLGVMDVSAEMAYFGIVANPGGILNNSGTLRRSAGAGLFSIAGFDQARTDSLRGTLNNTGTVQVQSGTMQFHGGRSTGTFDVASGTTLQCNGGHLFDSNTVSGAGTVRIAENSNEASGTITRNGGPLELTGVWRGGFSDVPDSSAIYNGTGTFEWKSGSMPGTWTWAVGTHIESSGDTVKSYSDTLTNQGTFDWLGGGPIACNNTSFINEGTFNCKAAGTFLADTYINGQTFDNRGTLNTFAGENSASDSGLVNSGTINIAGSGAGILSVPGFTNSGTVNLGVGDVLNPGSYTLQAASKLNVDIAGAGDGQFGRIQANGRSDVGGTLTANFVNYAPPAGTAFRVLTRFGGDGAFSNVTTQNLTAKTVTPVYDPLFVDLAVQAINVSIADASVLEGNTGSSNANFFVTLSQPAPQAVTVNYATLNGTATAPADFLARNGTLTIPTGQTRGVISIPIVGDVRDEANETFFIRLGTASGAVVTDNQALITIVDNDAPPALSINDVTLSESSASATFRIALSSASGQQVTVRANTFNGTATAPADYAAASANLVFAPGETAKTFTVAVRADNLDELNETFLALLSAPSNATLLRGRGTGTILDNDTTPRILIDDLGVRETQAGRTAALVRLRLSAPSGQIVRMNFATINGTATAGSDYVAAAPTHIAFNAGNTIAYARVLVNGDQLFEPNETFLVRLSSAENAVIADAQATVTIQNDDTAPTLSINDVSIVEGNAGSKALTFTIALSKAPAQSVSVSYATANVTAIAGSDYVARSGSLIFAPGTALTRSITIAINGDNLVERDETMLVLLSRPVNAGIVKTRGIGTIRNDDAITATNTVSEDNAAKRIPVREENPSSATANAALGSVSLRFVTALDVDSAVDIANYQVVVNDVAVVVEGVSYNRVTNTVTLLLAQASLVAGDELQARYHLRGTSGFNFAGQVALLATR